MNQEENVYEETTLTEQGQTEKIGAGEKLPPKNGSTVLGKFKNVDALAQAYSALQAEFTRRSQRLKELERITENLGKDKMGDRALGVEKLRKNATAKRVEAKRFDEFVAGVVADAVADKNAFGKTEGNVVENAVGSPPEPVVLETKQGVEQAVEKDVALDIANDTTEKAEQENAERENAEKQGVLSANEQEQMTVEKQVNAEQPVRFGRGEAGAVMQGSAKGSVVAKDEPATSSDGLYEKVLGNESVRLRIIGEYLASIGKSGAPITFGNAGICATPPMKAKSIADAGGMALHYFKSKPDVN